MADGEEPYSIVLTASARRALLRLPKKIAVAVVEFMSGTLASNPHRVGKPLRLELEGTWSARRGEYRILYRIDEPTRVVTVMTIAHCRHAYRT